MHADTSIIAFLATTDAPKARDFYEGRIGLAFVDESEFAIVFSAHGVELRIQKVTNVDPQPYTVLGWQVPSIDEAVQELANKGVSFKKFADLEQSELGVWSSPSGAKVAWFTDPDGNMLSVTQK